MARATLSVDFDGVIHSYESGWKGPRNIPDGPVPGAMDFLLKATEQFDVCIFSSRSKAFFGRWAMKRWLEHHLTGFIETASDSRLDIYTALIEALVETGGSPEAQARYIVNEVIKWPLFKPAALVTLDDRAVQFNGVFTSVDELRAFRPWNRRTGASS